MTTFDELEELRKLNRQAKELARKARLTKNGDSNSELSSALDAAFRALMPRSDAIGLEITEHILLFLRSLFGQNAEMAWRNDVESTDIIIESCYSQRRREEDLSKPVLFVRPGPNNVGFTSINHLKHYDRLSNTTTYTGLSPGTIQILAKARLPAQATILAEFVKRAIVVHRDELLFQRLHDIDSITVGGYEPENPYYNQGTDVQRVAVVPVTFTYYYQWTMRKGDRPGVWENATAAILAFHRKGDGEPADPVDGRMEAEVKLSDEQVLYAIPGDDE